MPVYKRLYRWNTHGFRRYHDPVKVFPDQLQPGWHQFNQGENLNDKEILTKFKTSINKQLQVKGMKNNKNQLKYLSSLVNFILSDIKYKYNYSKNAEKSTPFKTIHRLITSGHLNDNQLLDSVKKFQRTALSNISIPNHIVKHPIAYNRATLPINFDNLTSEHDIDIMATLDKLANKISRNKSKGNEMYQIFNNILEEQNELNVRNKARITKSGNLSDNLQLTKIKIDLNVLKDYLHRIEEQESQKNAMKQRIFDWNHSMKLMNEISNEKIVHESIFKPFSSLFSSIFPRKKGKDFKVKTQMLILDLKTNKNDILKTIPPRLSFNTRKVDAITISNSSSLNPTLVLNKIKELQFKNWKLIGDLYNEKDKVIFGRDIKIYNGGKNGKKSFILPTISLVTLLILVPWNSEKKIVVKCDDPK